MTSPAAAAATTARAAGSTPSCGSWCWWPSRLGILFGLVFPGPAEEAKWLADAFIQLIQTITGPVIFVTVVLGVASIGNLARAGGLAAARARLLPRA